MIKLWYEILGVDEKATYKEIEEAYKKIINNPNTSLNFEEIVEVSKAYEEGIKYLSNHGVKSSKHYLSSIVDSSYEGSKVNYVFSAIKIIVGVLIFFLIGMFFKSDFAFEQNDAKTKVVTGVDISDCLEYNLTLGEYDKDHVKQTLQDNEYKIKEDTNSSLTASKEIEGRTAIFTFNTKNNSSKCELSVSDNVSIDNTMYSRTINTTGDTLDIYEIYFYKMSSSVNVELDANEVNSIDTTDTYKINLEDDKKNDPTFQTLSVENDLALRDLLVEELENFR